MDAPVDTNGTTSVPTVPTATCIAAVIVDELIRHGVRHAVLCPGSRSTPLAFALAQAAHEGRLELHVRSDERTAAFLALGLSKAQLALGNTTDGTSPHLAPATSPSPEASTGATPLAHAIVPIIVTSGSAVGHLMPAVIEANMAHVPIMPLTADRPWSMVGTGASQTINQRELFGAHVVATFGLDAAVTDTLALGRVPSSAETSVSTGVDTDGCAFAPTPAHDHALAPVIEPAPALASDRDPGHTVPAAATEPAPADDHAVALAPSVLCTRSLVARAVAAATCGRPGPGPVHIDIPFADPFVAHDTAMLARVSQWAHTAGRPDGAPWTVLGGHADIRDERVLHIAGAGSRLVLPVPTVWEPSAPAPVDPRLRVHPLSVELFARGVGAGQGDIGSFQTADGTAAHGSVDQTNEGAPADCALQHVIVSGRPTLHRSITRLLARTDVRITVVEDPLDYPDVAGTAAQVVQSIECAPAPEYWARLAATRWEQATACVRELLDGQRGERSSSAGSGAQAGQSAEVTALSAASVASPNAAACTSPSNTSLASPSAPSFTSPSTAELTSLAVANEVLRSAEPHDAVVVGNSNAIRDIHYCADSWRGAELFTSRGTAGIDGFLSTTFGVALAREAATPAHATDTPHTLGICGDLTFLHDLTALNIGRAEPTPRHVTIVVTNDSGGAIFETLEAGRDGLRPFFERVVATPHRATLADLCRGFGWNYIRATTVDHVTAALRTARTSDDADGAPGITIVEAVCERASRRTWNHWLNREVLTRAGLEPAGRNEAGSDPAANAPAAGTCAEHVPAVNTRAVHSRPKCNSGGDDARN